MFWGFHNGGFEVCKSCFYHQSSVTSIIWPIRALHCLQSAYIYGFSIWKNWTFFPDLRRSRYQKSTTRYPGEIIFLSGNEQKYELSRAGYSRTKVLSGNLTLVWTSFWPGPTLVQTNWYRVMSVHLWSPPDYSDISVLDLQLGTIQCFPVPCWEPPLGSERHTNGRGPHFHLDFLPLAEVSEQKWLRQTDGKMLSEIVHWTLSQVHSKSSNINHQITPWALNLTYSSRSWNLFWLPGQPWFGSSASPHHII